MSRGGHVFARIVLALALIVAIFPVFLCLMNAFKADAEIMNNYFSMPASLYTAGFEKIIFEKGILLNVLNSLFVTGVTTFSSFIFIPFFSFMIIDHWYSRLYRVVFVILCASMFIPRNLILFPLIKRYYAWNLMNQTGVILYYTFSPLPESVFLLVPLFRKAGKSMKEAAMMDGCSYLQYYLLVFYPVCFSFVVAIVSLNCISIWNSFFMPLMILNKNPRSWTIPIFIYNFLGENDSQKNLAFATCLLSLMPMLLVYLFFHRIIIQSMESNFR